MKNIFEVIRQKEEEAQELQRQLDALRTAARLLSDERDHSEPAPRVATPAPMPARANLSVPVTAAAAAGALKEFP